MYIRTIRDLIPSKDTVWPPEPQEYFDLLQDYKKQGKLLDRIVTKINDHEFESVWIFDSKESYAQLRLEPVQIERWEQIKSYTQGILVSEEEI